MPSGWGRPGVAGTTVTHGVVLGAIPFVVLYPWLAGYAEGAKKFGRKLERD